MKEILQDVVAHTHAIGFPLLKFTANPDETKIDTMAEDRSVIMTAVTKQSVNEFEGVFGMSNLDKLSYHLKNPEYRKDAKLEIVTTERNGEQVPTYIHFENSTGDFQNDYRFMNRTIIEERLRTVTFRGADWDVVFTPTEAAINRMRLMNKAQSEEDIFTVKVVDDDLVFYFGDTSSHTGSFVFQPKVGGTLKGDLRWPVSRVLSILGLEGKIGMSISSMGAMKISVETDIAMYEYILPAQAL